MIAVVAASFFVAWFGFFFFRDNFSTHYPVKLVSAHVFRSGEIPFWNFHDGGGQPLAGNPNTLTFYPDNFLYLVLPAHVAFNLHFLVHLIAAWFAMRALSRSPYAAWLYVLSGVAISATAFYNLIVAIAVIPFAFWAAERRHTILLGSAFGLLALAGEPVTILAAAIAVLILWPSPRLLLSASITAVIALPQLIAYADIAGEVERAHGYSSQTVLNASLSPLRILEFVVGPIFHSNEPRLFLSVFIGVVVLPALWQRSRYLLVAGVSLFFALGAYNPIVAAAVRALPRLRIARYPEKFAIPLTIGLVVLAAKPLTKRVWQLVTIVPIAVIAPLMIPIDVFKPYDIPPQKAMRVFVPPIAGGQAPWREEYRARARLLQPAFGAAAGLRYGADRSGDGMFSLMSRVVAERVTTTHNARWLRIAGCQNVPGALPRAMFVPQIVGTAPGLDIVHTIESPAFDEIATALGPTRLAGFRSPQQARVISVNEHPQSLAIHVATPAPAVLFVNETYFRAWDAAGLQTFPLDLDRLGIMIPAGERTITLRFGRHRGAVAVTWAISLLVLALAAFALRVEVLDRGAGEIERAADEDRLVARA